MNKLKIACAFFGLTFLFFSKIYSQSLTTLSHEYIEKINLEKIPLITVKSFDNQALHELYKSRTDEDGNNFYSEIYAINTKTFFNLKESAMTYIEDNSKYYYIKVKSEKALGLQLLADEFHFPKGASITIFDKNKRILKGSYTNLSNSSKLNSGPLNSNEIIIEAKVPVNSDNEFKLIISEVAYIFYNAEEYLLSLDCHNNVICQPWEQDLCNQIRATVKLYILAKTDSHPDGAWARCSGVITNNANTDFTPYILTAAHCVENGDNPFFEPINEDKWMVYYNFQSNSCTPSALPNEFMTTTGIKKIKSQSSNCPDYALLESTIPIPIQFNVFYAGWNILSPSNHSTVWTIHHPRGDVKKVSEGEKIGTSPAEYRCFRVDLNNGIIEHGSSGGPLFGSDGNTIGCVSHTYKEVDCDNDPPIYFGKLKYFMDDVLQELSDNDNSILSISGNDPIWVCQNTIELNGDMYPASQWQNQNNLTIQANEYIQVANQGLTQLTDRMTNPVFHQGTANYTLQAGRAIVFNPGFNANAGYWVGANHVLLARIAECTPREDNCGLNYKNNSAHLPPSTIIRNSNISLDEEFEDEISIYPNPTKDVLTINSNLELPLLIEIFNILGDKINSFQIYTQPYKLNLQHLKSGVYIMNIKTKKGDMHYSKIVIE